MNSPSGDTAAPDCGHWIGDERRHCRSGTDVHRYVIGYRCPEHTPARLAGRPEPQPGPGWPVHRTEDPS
ncbi:hypothetical protein [Streptomyces sp. Z26]|uniref:hypothetical protein n=1 Tax=Streptomyces sp. Z26 TaxID=2500177 RepID=UPI000EF164A8|nr:hypothetical protein [Streptomyces sp. Z26]RLL68162.1 hypothetical protein D7M15_16410 [Streptomyces sp. Z26]